MALRQRGVGPKPKRRLLIALFAVLFAALLTCGFAGSRRVVSAKATAARQSVSSDEKKIVGAINLLRSGAKAGLLTLDYGLCGIAKKRAEAYITMASAKDSIPGVGTLAQMLEKAGIAALSADEYVSRSKPLSAVANWAASGGTNLVSANFNAVGCGIAKDGDKYFVDVVFAKLDPAALQNVASAPISTPAPSSTLTPSSTPVPLNTLTPSSELTPSNSPEQSNAPAPSSTPVPLNTLTPSSELTPSNSPAPSSEPTPTFTPTPTPAAAIARVTDGTPTKIELEFLELLNEQREAKKLTPITLQKNTNTAAQSRAWEVADTGKYSADSPKYGSYEELLKEFSVTYRVSGQALTHGINASPAGALKSLLKSSLYRPILMSPDFTHAGIGVSVRGTDQIYVMYLTD